MNTVFLLWHTGPPDIDDEGMLIGVFRREQDAKAAIAALAGKGLCGLSGAVPYLSVRTGKTSLDGRIRSGLIASC